MTGRRACTSEGLGLREEQMHCVDVYIHIYTHTYPACMLAIVNEAPTE